MKRRISSRIDAGVRGHIINTAKKNLWRVHTFIEIDDLVQDGFMCWMVVLRRYGDRDQKHLMALFQTTFRNHINQLANARTGNPGALFQSSKPDPAKVVVDVDSAILPKLSVQPDQLCLPPQVRKLIEALENGKGRSLYRRRAGGRRETTNERFCRLIGLDPETNDITALLQLALT
jgi:hypothetical protein